MTMDNGPLIYVYSASQVGDIQDCPRKWGLNKIDGIPKPPNRSALFGTAVHGQLEAYLKGAELDFAADHDAAAIAQQAIPHLPKPLDPGLLVETSLDMVSPHGHKWTGRIDWLHLRQLRDAPRGAPSIAVTIGDHKTTSSISSYAKTEAQLRDDPQAIIYSKWALDRYALDTVDLQWTYLQTKGAKLSDPRRLTLHRSEVEPKFSAFDSLIRDIDLIRREVRTAMDLPYNPDACEKYGGCPYRDRCNLSPRERMRAVMSNTPANPLYASLLAKTGAVAPGAPSAPVAPAWTPAPAPEVAPPPAPAPAAHTGLSALARRDAEGRVTHSLSGRPLDPRTIATQYARTDTGGFVAIDPITPGTIELLEKAAAEFERNPALGEWKGYEQRVAEGLQAPVNAPPPAAPAWTPPPAPVAPVAPPGPAAWTPPGMPTPAAAPPPPAINPPEWQPPPAAPIAPPPAPVGPAGVAPPADEGKARKCGKCGQMGHNARTCKVEEAPPAMPAGPAWVPPGVAAVPAAPPAPSAPGWTPPAATPPPTPAAPPTPVAVAPAAAPAPEVADVSALPGRMLLFVGCRVVRGALAPVFDFADILATCFAEIEAEEKTREGSPLADYTFADFGTGGGILSKYVESHVLKRLAAGETFAVEVDARSREWSVCGSRMVALSSLVVRG